MDNKTDILARFICEDCSNNYFEGKSCLDEAYAYVFESKQQRYVWLSKVKCNVELIVGNIYHLKAIEGRRLHSGQVINIGDVEVLGQMSIENTLIYLT
ncbi:hypothetical protein BSK66_26605 [Paenibacillus odorifer]|uniref:hypothetical protein n=1 Tax=Paenibacillus TaxID=44249 RepID=UPI0003E1E741|nr:MULTISPECIES: hypothetical protein [Paenibacillus]ETT49319.1 hypothetical protein C171_23640 [Paenibacillus sp. FSL H8-237]OME49531.1 hypothetical protein BSK66_26605 [Paenibacillus odorifer]